MPNDQPGLFKRILVVCVGNICRSPVACALFRDKVSHVQFDSAGISAVTDVPASPDSMQYAEAYAVDLSSHSTKKLDGVLLKTHDLILVMEESHIALITKKYPFTYGKVYLLGHWENKKEIYDRLCFLSQKVINLLFGSIAHKIAQYNHSSFNLCHINIQKIKVGKFPSKNISYKTGQRITNH